MLRPHQIHQNQKNTSLQFEKEFTYIDLVCDDLSMEDKKKTLKIDSKIIDRKMIIKKNSSINNRINVLNPYKSQMTKKSSNKQKQTTKGSLQNKKSSSKSLHKIQEGKKISKTLQIKPIMNKIQSNKSLKNKILSPKKKQNLQKRDNYFLKKKKKKRLTKVDERKIDGKTQRGKMMSNKKDRHNQDKSEIQLQKVYVSEIQPLKALKKQSKIFHEYFGMQNKLVSYIQPIKQKSKRLRSKLSKTKTSSSNISNHSSSKTLYSKFHMKTGKIKK